MSFQVNPNLCTGCGICEVECPEGAIQVIRGVAEINQILCKGCETCVELCPNGAIEVITEKTIFARPREIQINANPIPLQEEIPQTFSNPEVLQGEIIYPKPASPLRSLAPLASAVLAYVGREVMPRMMDALGVAIERQLSKPNRPAINAPFKVIPGQINRRGRGGKGKQIRFRGGR